MNDVKTDLGQDENWWRPVFTDHEHDELERRMALIVVEHEEQQEHPRIVEVTVEVPLDSFHETYEALHAWDMDGVTIRPAFQTLISDLGWAFGNTYMLEADIIAEPAASTAYHYYHGDDPDDDDFDFDDDGEIEDD